jgi:hypothetical protein
MSKELVVEEIAASGMRVAGQLTGQEVLIGREPGTGIAIPNGAISRVHAKFFRIRNHWFFQDLGSTNGSWHNGTQVTGDKLRIVRAGDTLQLADTPLRIGLPHGQHAGNLPQFSSSTLIVFADGEFRDEFPLPEYGRALVIGGSQGDLKLTTHSNDAPRLVIERRGEKVCAFGIADGTPIALNGAEVSDTVTLHDGDDLKIDIYSILFNDPGAALASQMAAAQAGLQGKHADESLTPVDTHETGLGGQGGSPQYAPPTDASGTHIRGMNYHQGQAIPSWPSGDPRPNLASGGDIISGSIRATSASSAASGGYRFGQPLRPLDEDVEGTVAMDPAEAEARLAGFDVHPGSRYGRPVSSVPVGLSSLEDKLVVFVGFMLLLALVAAVAWWILG